MLQSRKYLYIGLVALSILVLPFSNLFSDNQFQAIEVNDSSIGYYQSTTCNISLLEVYLENIGNQKNIKYNNNNYAGIECFGKVTGLDKVNNIYIVSIGTNSNLTLVYQSIIWCLVLLLIKGKNNYEINLLIIIPLCLLFTYQHISEGRFYSQINKYWDETLFYKNYYLITIFLSFYLILLFVSIFVDKKDSLLINYIPYIFLFVGTFNGMNFNFVVLILSYFGLKAIINREAFNLINLGYLSLSVFWLFSRRDVETFFDTDKLRGFINSSNNFPSLIYWSLLIWLVMNGLIYLYKVSEININLLKQNFLVSSTMIVSLGLLGAWSPVFNFFNYLTFGQNKRGINSINSVAGNTWRGFSSSAESIGEFYGFVILFLFILTYLKKIKLNTIDFLFIAVCIYGLYKTNNFAVALSLLLISSLIVLNHRILNKTLLLRIKILFVILGVVLLFFLIQTLNYEYVSTELMYEASLHSNLFENLSSYSKSVEITNYFNEGQIDSLLNLENKGKGSTTLILLSKIYNQSVFDVPIVPNFVSLISLISILINRTEMWGIFIAKYSPNLLEALFGNGPYQLNNYLFLQDITLDMPEEKLDSLFLPHSSFLDIIVFFGLIGFTFFIIYNLYLYLIKHKDSDYKYLLFFLIINFSKSDSLLYVSSVVLLTLVYTLLRKQEI
tara:strand:- start:1159 stop:3168 length:2010 start_codon:yes stop_codon:yes gene_type:complete